MRNVVIVCSANMCRSPMAAGYLNKRLKDLSIEDIDVQSAALYYEGGMQATDGARHVANENGFSLDRHRSSFLDDAMFKWADEILVMTVTHKHDLYSRFGQRCEGKVFMLGSFEPGMEDLPDHQVEVIDPYQVNLATYMDVFEQIRNSIDNWLDLRTKR
jgi:protein-tyrosine phosphatase